LAHPLDEVVQGAYLTLRPGEVRLELDLSVGPLVADEVLKVLDANGDRRISEAEAQGFGRRVLAVSQLTLDGKAVAWTLRSVTTPAYDNIRLGADTVKVFAVARRPESKGAHGLGFQNRYDPAKSQCAANIFLQPADGWRYRVEGQTHGADGRALNVRYTASR
jgi:hypothetical protein